MIKKTAAAVIDSRPSGRHLVLLLLLLTALAVSLLWPGDHFWGRPDPWQTIFWNYPEQIETMRTAMQANRHHEPAARGVRGSLPVVYHPLHVWIYQLLLYLTPEPAAIVFVKQLITLCLCLSGLWYLSGALGFPLYPVWLFLFSPFLYVYSRQLSDDPWLIPLSLLAYCCYARFHRKRGWPAAVAGLSVLVLMVFIHPRGLLPAAAFLFLFVVFEYQWLKAHAWVFLILLVLALALVLPSLSDIYHQLQAAGGSGPRPTTPTAPTSGLVDLVFGPNVSRLNALFPLISGGLFFSYDFMQLFPDSFPASAWLSPSITRLLVVISMTGYALVAAGLLITVARLIRGFSGRRFDDLEDRLGAISLLAVCLYLIQVIAFLAVRKFYPPDYHSGIWFCYFYFMWRTISACHRMKAIRRAIQVYVTVMAVLWVNMILTIHASGEYNLGEAVRLARRIAVHSPRGDVVLPADFTSELNRQLDALKAGSSRAALSFYYQPYILETRAFTDKTIRQQVNLLDYSLAPLVSYYRRQGKTDYPAPRPLVIRWVRESGRRRLALVEDAEAVRRELEKAGINGLMFPPGQAGAVIDPDTR